MLSPIPCVAVLFVTGCLVSFLQVEGFPHRLIPGFGRRKTLALSVALESSLALLRPGAHHCGPLSLLLSRSGPLPTLAQTEWFAPLMWC